jgi:hypothetical protein
MTCRVLRCVDGKGHHTRLRVIADRIDFACRKARVREQTPRVELRRGEHQHDLRDAILTHDHHAIAALHAEIGKLPGGVVDGSHEFRRAQTPLVFDQHNMLRIAGGDARGNLRNTRGQCGKQGIDINFHLKSPCRASTRER